MDKKELEIIRKIKFGNINARDLLEIYNDFDSNYRVVFFLIQHPSFSEKIALNIIPRLFTNDLIRLIKNRRTNPFIRKRAEVEFVNKYPRYALGEKIGYMKTAPISLLNYFIREDNKKILNEIFDNPQCTEELILKMINRKDDGKGKYNLYEILLEKEWLKRKRIAEGIANDKAAPIRVILKILPYLSINNLQKLFSSESTHKNIKNGITKYLNSRIKKSY